MSSDTDQPLALFFDQTNKVLLAAFSGAFTQQATIDLDTGARALQARHGPFAVILDFTEVTEFAIQLRDWPQFAANRRAIRGTRRLLVLPPNDIFSPLRLYGTQRGGPGGDSDVVSTRADALRQLGLKSPTFEPVVSA
ncbi:MAG: hypothetical protein K2X72_15470 [Reyranella sp.]|nr:hypothetical protein [Reyranella sp.]